MSDQILKLVEANCIKPASEINEFEIGDTVNVHCRILEGEKERIQLFNGVVIARSGSGSREMFTVRRIVAGEGVERKFALHSPRIAKVETVRSAVVHRAKLYFLRDRVGKAVRLKERIVKRKIEEAKVAKPVKKRGSKGKKKTTTTVTATAE
ncbi:MAG: 50S ribosomal protein L19 [Planctomycetaceae bacterium]|jgi:large subunit ribosomal protein L19|nr:50S ribosomal protein L19 [Planctomycetaceae bacterium]